MLPKISQRGSAEQLNEIKGNDRGKVNSARVLQEDDDPLLSELNRIEIQHTGPLTNEKPMSTSPAPMSSGLRLSSDKEPRMMKSIEVQHKADGSSPEFMSDQFMVDLDVNKGIDGALNTRLS